jgi:hypothetical protein
LRITRCRQTPLPIRQIPAFSFLYMSSHRSARIPLLDALQPIPLAFPYRGRWRDGVPFAVATDEVFLHPVIPAFLVCSAFPHAPPHRNKFLGVPPVGAICDRPPPARIFRDVILCLRRARIPLRAAPPKHMSGSAAVPAAGTANTAPSSRCRSVFY